MRACLPVGLKEKTLRWLLSDCALSDDDAADGNGVLWMLLLGVHRSSKRADSWHQW